MKGGARFQVAGTEALRARFNLALFLLSMCFPFPRTRNLVPEVENAKARGHVWSLGSYQMQTDVQAVSDTLLVQVAVLFPLFCSDAALGPSSLGLTADHLPPKFVAPFPLWICITKQAGPAWTLGMYFGVSYDWLTSEFWGPSHALLE